ncbi:unnamed protein product [Trichogramma brassicae]|uniref:Uncharacterized protein n=1 Tax=Trichogramma brassicae TaxID=86971 RepID=A0A6H5IIJ4_9HYME|nr:unnamed protein product [Trichogramma brassicae]
MMVRSVTKKLPPHEDKSIKNFYPLSFFFFFRYKKKKKGIDGHRRALQGAERAPRRPDHEPADGLGLARSARVLRLAQRPGEEDRRRDIRHHTALVRQQHLLHLPATAQRIVVSQTEYEPSGDDTSLVNSIYFFGSFIFLIGRTVSVTLLTARISDQCKVILPVLYNCPSANFCTEAQRLQQQIASDDVALTGLRFFSITRNFMLAVSRKFEKKYRMIKENKRKRISFLMNCLYNKKKKKKNRSPEPSLPTKSSCCSSISPCSARRTFSRSNCCMPIWTTTTIKKEYRRHCIYYRTFLSLLSFNFYFLSLYVTI